MNYLNKFFTLLLLVTTIFGVSNVNAQVFSEDFNTGIPGTFTIIDNDGNTPAAGVSQFTDGWIGDFDGSESDSVAASTSWYNPANQSDDWLITPAISLTSGLYLTWKALAVDPNFPDGYEVWITNTGTTVADFTSNGTMIFSTAAENPSWKSRAVDLDALGYTSGNYYVGFRNNSTDQYILYIDDIVVADTSVLCPDNVQRVDDNLGPVVNGYRMIPKNHLTNLSFIAAAENFGFQSETVAMAVEVQDASASVVHSDTSSSFFLPTGQRDTISFGSWLPTDTGWYYPYITIINPGACSTAVSYADSIYVSDTVYAMEEGIDDDGVAAQGASLTMGQNFDINVNDSITSVSLFLRANTATGDSFKVVVMNTLVTGEPSSIVTSSATQFIPGGSGWITVPITSNNYLTAGTYFIGVQQLDTNRINLAVNSNTFAPERTWVEITVGSSSWSNNEDYNIFSNYLVRPNFAEFVAPFIKIYDIQYTTNPSGDSPYMNQVVTTRGVVTAVRNDGRFYIQDSSSTWNGILVYENGTTVNVGDSVEVTGEVVEWFGLTEFNNGVAVTVLNSGNSLPSPLQVTTAQANDESYEGVLISVSSAQAISNIDGFNEWYSHDGSDTLIVDDELLFPDFFNPTLNSYYDITGIITYTFGDFKLLPRDTIFDIGLWGTVCSGIDSTGGPDSYGYSWYTSGEGGANEPTYSWIDITGVGTQVIGIGDDDAVGPVDMGWDFPFYWYDVSKFSVGSNGYINFGNTPQTISSGNYGPGSNEHFPGLPYNDPQGDFNNLVAPFLTDLNPSDTVGDIYYYSNGTDLTVISFIDVPYWNSATGIAGSNTFQIILDGLDSSITFQYEKIQGSWNSNYDFGNSNPMVIGIESKSGVSGLTVSNLIKPCEKFVIKFKPASAPLLSVTDVAMNHHNLTKNRGYFAIVGDSSYVTVNLSNEGSVNINSDIDINTRIERYTNGTISSNPIYNPGGGSSGAFFTQNPLNTDQEVNYTYPIPFIPVDAFDQGEPGHYYINSASSFVDSVSGNDEVNTELQIIDYQTDGTLEMDFFDTLSTSPFGFNGGAVYLPVPSDSLLITDIQFFGIGTTSPDGNITLSIHDRDSNGDVGTVLYDTTLLPADIVFNASGGLAQNIVELELPLFAPDTGFYVSFVNGATNFSIAEDNQQPFSNNNFESLDAGITFADYRNNYNADIMLGVIVEPSNLCPHDVAVVDDYFINAFDHGGYYYLPLGQTRTLPFVEIVRNKRIATENVKLSGTLERAGAGIVYSAVDSMIFGGGTQDTIFAGGYAPFDTGLYRASIELILDSSDCNPENNYDTTYFHLTDTIYSREAGYNDAQLGLGSSNGILGQNFTIYNGDSLTSVSFFLNDGAPVGDSARIHIYSTINSVPNSILVSSDYIVIDDSSKWFTYPMQGGNYYLAPGEYFIGIEQVGTNNIRLATSSEFFYPGTTWGEFPVGAANWDNMETYGFDITFLVRANFGSPACNPGVATTTDSSGCAGSNIVLNTTPGSGTTTCKWYDTPSGGVSFYTGTSYSNTYTSSDTFYVASYDGAACESPVRTMVIAEVLASPSVVASASPDSVICEGDSVTISGTGAVSYTWDNGLGAGVSHVVSPISSTQYVVTGTGANTCTAMDTINITVNPLPTANAGSDQTICDGQSANLSASGGTTYTWDNGLGAGANQIVSPSSTTQYIVTAVTNGCSDTDSVTINVNPSPTANAGSDQTICDGQSANITATGGGTYNWDNGLGAGASHTVSPSSTTEYIVTVTSAGCSDTDSVTINVTPLPNANAGSDQTICDGQSTNITATGGGTYSWDNGLGAGASHTVSPTSTTEYIVTVTNAGCSKTDSVTINVTPLPTANAGSDQSICFGQSANISASGGTSYNWDNGLGAGANHTVSPSDTTTYTVTVTASGCSNTDQVTINVKPLPAANAGNDVMICNGASANLFATGGVSYFWDNGLGAGQQHVVAPVSNTTYTVTVTGANGCTATDNITVTVNPIPGPTANAGSDTAICAGESVNLQASGGTSYNWDNGLGNGSIQTVTPANTTTYTVTVTDGSGCSDIDDITVVVNSSPVANAGSDVAICEGKSTTLIASGGGTYTWDNGLGSGATHTVSPSVTTIYTVTVTNTNGCEDTDDLLVTVNPAPDKPVITLFGGDLLSSATTGNQWLYNGVTLPGATDQTYTPSEDGFYSVRVTDTNGCFNTSDSIEVILDPGGIEDNILRKVVLYPNPSSGVLTLDFQSQINETAHITLFDVSGRSVWTGSINALNNGKKQIDIDHLESGVYQMHITIGSSKTIKKVVLQK